MRARRFAPTLALVLALVTGACGGGGDNGEGGADDDALSTTTTSAAPATGDQAVVDKIVLEKSDFPAGWTAAPADDSEDEAEERALVECLGVPYEPDRPEVRSPQYSKGELNQVLSTAELAPTPEVAASELAAVQGAKANECVKAAFDRTIAKNSGGVSFAPAQVEAREAPKVGDGAHALRLITGVAAPDGTTVPIYADFFFIQKGRAEINMTFITASEPFDPALADDLAQKLVSRA